MSAKRDYILYGTVLGLLLVKAHLSFVNYSTANFGIDGSYYLDVAQNVRDGLGLTTDISPYHQNLPYFPYPSTIYPLWPLLLGYLGRVVPIEFAAVWLPTLLYGVALVLMARVGRTYFPGTAWSWRGVSINAGHLLALIFALHVHYFGATSRPYTEGLAMVLLALLLLRAPRLLDAPNLWRGLELGLWAALCFLARSQFIVVFAALLCAVGILAPRVGWRASAGALLGLAVGFAVGWLPEWLYLSTFVPSDPWHAYLFFDDYQANDAVASLDVHVQTSGAWEWLVDRFMGLVYALNPVGKEAYVRVFDAITYAPVLALPLWIGKARDAWQTRRLPQLTSRQVFFVSFALVSAAAVHSVHLAFWGEWLFNKRHSLLVALALFLGLWTLLQSSIPLARRVGWALVIIALCGNGSRIVAAARANTAAGHPSRESPELISWINEQAPEPGTTRTTFAGRLMRQLAPKTPHAAYHELRGTETLADLQTVMTDLGTRYLLIRRDEPFDAQQQQDGAFARAFTRTDSRGAYDIFVAVPSDSATTFTAGGL